MQKQFITICLGLMLTSVVALMALTGCTTAYISGRQIDPKQVRLDYRFDGGHLCCHYWETNSNFSVHGRNTLASVRVRTNYLYALGTVLSFGIWMPFDLEWYENQDDALSPKDAK